MAGKPRKSFEETALLPQSVEMMLAHAALTERRCDNEFILKLRNLLLPRFAINKPPRKCKACGGTRLRNTMIDGRMAQVGCDACG